MITQSFSSPMLAEGIGAFTSQFKKGGMTNKNRKKKLSKAEMDLIQMYAEGGEVTKKDTYAVGEKIKFKDTLRREEREGVVYQVKSDGYLVNTGSGVRSVDTDEVIGALAKEEGKKKRFGLFAKGGSVGNARTKGRESQNWEQRLKEYAGENYNNLTANEREEIISDMKKSYDRNYSYAKGGEVGKFKVGDKVQYEFGYSDSGSKLTKKGEIVDFERDYAIVKSKNYDQSSNKNIITKSHVSLDRLKKYAEGGTTDPKPSAQDILKRLGYNIPEPDEEVQEEKIIRGWVDDEPYYFKGGGMSKDNSPKVYIADLMEYNNGRLVGKWFDLTDYSDASELMKDIQAMLDEQTKKDKNGEVHEEWAVHDYENFPRSMYSEYMGEEDFQKIIDVIQGAEDSDLPFDVILEAMSDLGVDEISEVVERYYGSVQPSMGNEWRDFAYEFVDSVGGVSGVSNADYYFDFEAFGRDERINMGGEAEEEMGYEDLTDEQLGEQLVDEIGGVSELSESTIDMYFDYDKFGRELQYDFTSIRGEDGDYYFFNSNYKKGGKVKSKPKSEDDGEYELTEEDKKIIRGYVDDEPYYFAEGGGVSKQSILSFSFNTDNVKLNDVKKVVGQFSKDWRTSGDISEVNMFVTIASSKVSDLKYELKQEFGNNVYDVEVEKSRYAEGGEVTMEEKKRSLKGQPKLKF